MGGREAVCALYTEAVTLMHTFKMPAGLVLGVVLLSGCELFGPTGAPSQELREVAVYDAIEPEGLEVDPATIRGARLQGAILSLQVAYSGGCAEHRFDLLAGRGLSRSIPPQATLHLLHDDGGDTCEALLTETLAYDLSPLLEAWRAMGLRGRVILRVFEPGGRAEPAATLALDLR